MRPSICYTILGALIAGISITSIVLSSATKSKNPQSQPASLLKATQAKLALELQKGDLKSAEADALWLQAHYRAGADPLILADIYYQEGRNSEALQIYKNHMLTNTTSNNDTDEWLRFGSLSEQSGSDQDAFTAYRKVVSYLAPYAGREVVAPLLGNPVALADVREAAKALVAGQFHCKGYINTIIQAVKVAPAQPCTHLVCARLLAQFHKLREANAELEKAAVLLNPDEGKRFRSFWYRALYFDRYDHISKGVIGKGGRVEIKYIKVPLPNSNSPMVESIDKTMSTVTP